MAILLLGIIIGAGIGMICSAEFQRFNIRKLLKSIKKELYLAYEEGVKFGTVQPKIDRINELSLEQLKYLGSMDQPNASAAHARHKNTIVSTIKAMEEEKIQLFRDIIKSGADPMLTVAIDGTTKSMRASELLPYLESGDLPQDTTTQSKTDPITPSNTRALRVVKNSEENIDDGNKSNPSDSTVH